MNETSIRFELTNSDKDLFKSCADKAGFNLSVWIRDRLRSAAKLELGTVSPESPKLVSQDKPWERVAKSKFPPNMEKPCMYCDEEIPYKDELMCRRIGGEVFVAHVPCWEKNNE
jgi:hypothetical protein